MCFKRRQKFEGFYLLITSQLMNPTSLLCQETRLYLLKQLGRYSFILQSVLAEKQYSFLKLVLRGNFRENQAIALSLSSCDQMLEQLFYINTAKTVSCTKAEK